MGMGNRLAELRKEKGYTREEFAEVIGISKYTLRNYELEKTDPGHTFLKKMSDFFDVSCDYLLCLTDEREKMQSYNLKSSEYSMVEKYRFITIHSPDGAGVVDTVLDREHTIATQLKEQSGYIKKLKTPTVDNSESTIDTRLINYYYRLASAGTGQIVFDMPPTKKIEIPDIPEYRNVDYAIGVNGRSMEPEFNDGDTLLIEMTEEIAVGEIGIFLVDNESYVKKLGVKELVSLNSEYKNIPLTENSKCMGKVVDKL